MIHSSLSFARRALGGLLVLFLASLAAPPARADLVFFKDGFVFQGRVRRESVAEFDSQSKEMFTMPRGFFFLSDGPRRMFFSPTQVRIAEKLPAPIEIKLEVGRVRLLLNPRQVPPILEVLDAPDWNTNWERVVTLRSPTGRVSIKQVMAELTPTYFRGDAIEKVEWFAGYLTKELTPEAVQTLIENNETLKDTTPLKDGKAPDEKDVIARRMRKIDFYGQGGWLDLAGQEIDRLASDYPAERERVEGARRALARLKGRDRLEQIKRWEHGGRHEAVAQAAAAYPTKDVPETMLSEIREIRSRASRNADAVKEADALLADLTRSALEPAHRLLAEAAADIRKELHPDTIDRLEAFRGQARQAARQQAAGRKPERTPPELLSLAVTGWLLGSSSSEARPESALNLWQTRQMVLAYLREDDAASRDQLLANYLKTVTPRIEVDEVAQLIPTLPPVTPARELDANPVLRMAGGNRRPSQYQLLLPPEYSHHRPYPVLVVLHEAGEKATAMIARWKAAAAENGYILVAPEWEQGSQACTYSDAEHEAVLGALADVKRSYQVDSDRVFLFGLGEGGKLAFDVGLSNPSTFAGLMPMGCAPFYYPGRCWRNAQYLPLYVVNGSKAGDSQTQLRQMFNNWILRGYPTLWVAYAGRGQEWFAGEVPTLCDWMSRQTRVLPMRQLGSDGLGSVHGNEFTTLRASGNRFYWLSIDDVNPRNVVRSLRNWNNLVSPATITGRLDPDRNEVVISAAGARKLSLWVVRTARGQYNIDLDKPLTVMLGLRTVIHNRKVTPSLAVLLEDLHQRADRQQLVVGRVEVTP